MVSAIKNGTHYGESLLYSDEEVELKETGARYRARSPYPDAAHPDIDATEAVEPDEWDQLVRLADEWQPPSARSIVGTPDASDAGAEFLEIAKSGSTVRIDFEVRRVPAEILPLVEKLRGIRRRLRAKYRPS